MRSQVLEVRRFGIRRPFDLAIAVADANHWARLHRLVGLPSELGYAGEIERVTPRELA